MWVRLPRWGVEPTSPLRGPAPASAQCNPPDLLEDTFGSGAATGAHHHGDQETVLYVISGTARYRWSDKLENVAEAGPGKFVFIPAQVVHQEINASSESEAARAVVRSGVDPSSSTCPLDEYAEPAVLLGVPGRVRRQRGAASSRRVIATASRADGTTLWPVPLPPGAAPSSLSPARLGSITGESRRPDTGRNADGGSSCWAAGWKVPGRSDGAS
ncbi:hypothetical protein JCM4814A_93090 [Streptomyces phaeofaciens JCM 4814]|uniref:Cupin type-2 domain-containing protein n=1 Tax=Streptomyces phaeofaciens TaxID=68254 RepID=A0A918HJZ4_9ACTN|nr:cupin domain-containing protein [Streptomyces phaeofaciens]GGT71210.1 hypothetical protein GCM10010226_56430 [Streptomyces phaeofaciens]